MIGRDESVAVAQIPVRAERRRRRS